MHVVSTSFQATPKACAGFREKCPAVRSIQPECHMHVVRTNIDWDSKIRTTRRKRHSSAYFFI